MHSRKSIETLEKSLQNLSFINHSGSFTFKSGAYQRKCPRSKGSPHKRIWVDSSSILVHSRESTENVFPAEIILLIKIRRSNIETSFRRGAYQGSVSTRWESRIKEFS